MYVKDIIATAKSTNAGKYINVCDGSHHFKVSAKTKTVVELVGTCDDNACSKHIPAHLLPGWAHNIIGTLKFVPEGSIALVRHDGDIESLEAGQLLPDNAEVITNGRSIVLPVSVASKKSTIPHIYTYRDGKLTNRPACFAR